MEPEKELWGRKFKIVKDGLDEADVYSFFDDLMSQYARYAKKLEDLDALVNRLSRQQSQLATGPSDPSLAATPHGSPHSDSNGNDPELIDFPLDPRQQRARDYDSDRLANVDFLTKFAERTIVEAAKQARLISAEIEEHARAQANEIISQARDEAAREAQGIIDAAENRASGPGTQPSQAIPIDGNSNPAAAEGNHAGAGTSADAAAQAVLDAQRDASAIREQALAQARDLLLRAAQQVAEGGEQVSAAADAVQQNAAQKGKPDKQEVLSQVHEQLSSLVEALQTSADEIAESPEHEDDFAQPRSPDDPDPSDPVDQETSPAQEAPGPADDSDNHLFDGTVELALPPPVGLDRMLQLHKHLKQTPNIDVLNLGGSVDKGITIRVVLDAPTDLLKVVSEFPEIGEVLEESPGGTDIVPSRQGQEETPLRRIIVNTKG
jgi:uncharacterized coiled-coil protein SlyX